MYVYDMCTCLLCDHKYMSVYRVRAYVHEYTYVGDCAVYKLHEYVCEYVYENEYMYEFMSESCEYVYEHEYVYV